MRANRGTQSMRLVDEQGRVHEVTMRARLSANDFSFLRSAAIQGAGIAALPTLLCCADVREERLVPVLRGYLAAHAGVFLVHPGARLLSAKVKAFWDFAAERLERLSHEGHWSLMSEGAPRAPARRKKTSPVED